MNTSVLENLSEKERRKFPRYEIESQMNLSIEDIRSGVPISAAKACDLSMGGLRIHCLALHPQIDIGNSLGVLLMENDITIFVQAEVVHNGTKDYYGLEFYDLTIGERNEIQRLIQRIAH